MENTATFPLYDVIVEINKSLKRADSDPNPVPVIDLCNVIFGIATKFNFFFAEDVATVLQFAPAECNICIRGVFGCCSPSTCKDCMILEKTLQPTHWAIWCKQLKPIIRPARNIPLPSAPIPIPGKPTGPMPGRSGNEPLAFIHAKPCEFYGHSALPPFSTRPAEYGPPIDARAMVPPIYMEPTYAPHYPRDHHLPKRMIREESEETRKPVPCRYAMKCTNTGCEFIHPDQINCRYGLDCDKDRCPYMHPRSHRATKEERLSREERLAREDRCSRTESTPRTGKPLRSDREAKTETPRENRSARSKGVEASQSKRIIDPRRQAVIDRIGRVRIDNDHENLVSSAPRDTNKRGSRTIKTHFDTKNTSKTLAQKTNDVSKQIPIDE
ncbi:putative ORFan [Tupanvirus deep ocean]|uniref:ORFan n=2 Tax=Tupanvirus TaxID=2094720 RepID=A0AC62A6U6_9VIRU|nr:putative ORFan [Tupanvirus deep ocean]QKU33505.1 putative ORFan [Tupanvirus deep ocean]